MSSTSYHLTGNLKVCLSTRTRFLNQRIKVKITFLFQLSSSLPSRPATVQVWPVWSSARWRWWQWWWLPWGGPSVCPASPSRQQQAEVPTMWVSVTLYSISHVWPLMSPSHTGETQIQAPRCNPGESSSGQPAVSSTHLSKVFQFPANSPAAPDVIWIRRSRKEAAQTSNKSLPEFYCTEARPTFRHIRWSQPSQRGPHQTRGSSRVLQRRPGQLHTEPGLAHTAPTPSQQVTQSQVISYLKLPPFWYISYSVPSLHCISVAAMAMHLFYFPRGWALSRKRNSWPIWTPSTSRSYQCHTPMQVCLYLSAGHTMFPLYCRNTSSASEGAPGAVSSPQQQDQFILSS